MAQKHSSFRAYVNIFDDFVEDSYIEGYQTKEDNFEVLSDTEIEAVTTEYLSHEYGQSSSTEDPDTSTSNSSSGGPVGDKNMLCGYLKKHKQGARSSLYKKRWFIFSRDICKLFYYRTPDDIIPLGDIDIAHASFSIHVEEGIDSSSQKVFAIRTQGRQYLLEAEDDHTRQYWLQELQKHRREFSLRRTKLAKKEKLSSKVEHTGKGGLVCQDLTLSLSDEHSPPPNLMQPIDAPSGVGEASAQSQTAGGIRDLSFAHLRTELRNIFTAMKIKRQSTDAGVNTASGSAPVSPVTSPSGEQVPNNPLRSKVQQQIREMTNKIVRPKTLSVQVKSDSIEGVCHRCKQLTEDISQVTEDNRVLEEELEATREVLRVIQKQVDVHQHRQSTISELDKGTDPEKLLQERDERIVNLEHLLAIIDEEKCILKAQTRSLESEHRSLLEKIIAFEETLKAKDEVVMSLSNQLQEFHMKQATIKQFGDTGVQQGTVVSIPCQADNAVTVDNLIEIDDCPGETKKETNPRFCTVNYKEADKLKDELEGYKSQNKFLNKEILELTKLRMHDETRETALLNRCAELEARYYQMQSKYLISLKELSSPERGGDEHSEEMVTQLIAEAMAMDVRLQSTHQQKDPVPDTRQRMRYDDDGFSLVEANGTTQDTASKFSSLESWSLEMAHRVKNHTADISTQVKWETFMVEQGPRELQRSNDLKNLIRAGIPRQYRQRVWKACINHRIGKMQQQYGSDYYPSLLNKFAEIETSLNPIFKQIEMDLLRTLPNNKFYESVTSEGISKLRNILNAYAIHSPGMGYCQGVNRLAAIALLYLEEEDAFWCLVTIIDNILPPEYYTSTLLAAQVDQKVLHDLVVEKLPYLYQHLNAHSVDLTMFTFNWFLTVYVDALPSYIYLRIWDTFLYEGSKVLFRFGLALLKYCENELMSKSSPMELHRYLQTLSQSVTDSNKLWNIAFKEINPLSMKTINEKRVLHKSEVKAELLRIASLRSNRRPESERKAMPQDFASDDDA